MPKLRFKLNKLLDKKVCNSFLFEKGGGIDFGKGIVKIHPELSLARKTKEKEKRKRLISDYINNFYKNHSFQSGAVYVTSHELLHFIFYDYFEKKFKKEFKEISEENLWEVSEIFNAVLFSFKPLSNFAPKHKERFDYPAFKSEIKKTKRIWQKSEDIDKLILFLLKN